MGKQIIFTDNYQTEYFLMTPQHIRKYLCINEESSKQIFKLQCQIIEASLCKA